MATVPLVVAKISVLPSATEALYSTGEFPLVNPSTILPCRSPPSSVLPLLLANAALAASTLGWGSTAVAPLASAETMVVVARSTSTTITVSPDNDSGVTVAGRRTAFSVESVGIQSRSTGY